MWPCLTSGINALPKWLDTRALDGIDEQLVRPIAQLDIGGRDIFHDVGHLCVRHGRAHQGAERGVLVGLAAERDLIKLLAVLLDPKNADVADVVMAAGVDAAGNVDMQPPEVPCEIEIAEAARDL